MGKGRQKIVEKDNSLRFISKSHQASITEEKPPPYFSDLLKVIISNKKESHNKWMKGEIAIFSAS